MAKLARKLQKIFGGTANADQIAVFGTMKTGTPSYSSDVETLQSSAYSQGWSSAILDDKAPYKEEMNGVQYGLSYQTEYILQNGIPEWIATETYYKYQFCRVNNVLYYSNSNNNINHNPTSDRTNWAIYGVSTVDIVNALYPVGSIYMGITANCPLASIVGTWTKIQGRYILASGMIAGTNETVNAGNTVGAGLPNITGNFNQSDIMDYSWANGAFYLTGSGQPREGGGDADNRQYVSFNASRSNSIYGQSATVRPPAYVVNVWRRTA